MNNLDLINFWKKENLVPNDVDSETTYTFLANICFDSGKKLNFSDIKLLTNDTKHNMLKDYFNGTFRIIPSLEILDWIHTKYHKISKFKSFYFRGKFNFDNFDREDNNNIIEIEPNTLLETKALRYFIEENKDTFENFTNKYKKLDCIYSNQDLLEYFYEFERYYHYHPDAFHNTNPKVSENRELKKQIKHIVNYINYKTGIKYNYYLIKYIFSALRTNQLLLIHRKSADFKNEFIKIFGEAISSEFKYFKVDNILNSLNNIYFSDALMNFIFEASLNPHKVYIACLCDINLLENDIALYRLLSSLEKDNRHFENNGNFIEIPNNIKFVATINNINKYSPVSYRIIDKSFVIELKYFEIKKSSNSTEKLKPLSLRSEFFEVKLSKLPESINRKIYNFKKIFQNNFDISFDNTFDRQVSEIYASLSFDDYYNFLDIIFLSKLIPKINTSFDFHNEKDFKNISKFFNEKKYPLSASIYYDMKEACKYSGIFTIWR